MSQTMGSPSDFLGPWETDDAPEAPLQCEPDPLDPGGPSRVLFDPGQEREDQEEDRDCEESIERPRGDGCLHAERGIAEDSVDTQGRERKAPEAPVRGRV